MDGDLGFYLAFWELSQINDGTLYILLPTGQRSLLLKRNEKDWDMVSGR